MSFNYNRFKDTTVFGTFKNSNLAGGSNANATFDGSLTVSGVSTFSGTVSGITKTMVGLSSADNTTDMLKPVSTATQSALDLKGNLASPTFTGTPSAPTAVSGTNTTQLATCAFVLANGGSGVNTATQSALDLKGNLASPTFTGTPSAPTAVSGTNTTQLATCAFVLANAGSGGSGGSVVSNLTVSAPSTTVTYTETNRSIPAPIYSGSGSTLTDSNGLTYTIRESNGRNCEQLFDQNVAGYYSSGGYYISTGLFNTATYGTGNTINGISGVYFQVNYPTSKAFIATSMSHIKAPDINLQGTPVLITIFGSSNRGISFTTVVTDLAVSGTLGTLVTSSFTNTTAYSTYVVMVTRMAGNKTGFFMGELSLMGTYQETPEVVFKDPVTTQVIAHIDCNKNINTFDVILNNSTIPNGLYTNARIWSDIGYRCKAGTSGGVGSNTFNTFWTGTAINFWIDGTNVGSICDYRVKENKKDVSAVLDRLCDLKMYDFTHKEVGIVKPTGNHIGLNAHDLQEAFCEYPRLVNGVKDQVHDDGSINPQSIETNILIFILMKAIQEQNTVIKTLRDEVLKIEQILKTI